MVIKEITFQNFKSFGPETKNQTLRGLDILTLIYGENNSGKSNILKFIELIFKRKVELSEEYEVSGQSMTKPSDKTGFWQGRIENNAFLFHKNNRSQDITFSMLVGINRDEISKLENSKTIIKELGITKKTFDLKIEAHIRSLVNPYDSEIVLDSVHLNKKEIYSIKDRKGVYFQGVKNGPLKNDSIAFGNLMGILTDSVVFLDHNRFLITEGEDNSNKTLTPAGFKNWLRNLSQDPVKYSQFEKFIQFVKEHSISGQSGKVLKEFEPTFGRKDGEIEMLLKSNSERLPINSFGTGIMQILIILSLVFESNAKIVLIEELELNLSPKSQQELLQILLNLIKGKKIDQVIFSSHSKLLAETQELSVFEVEMLSTGVSKITSKTKISEKFFARDTAIDKQMASVLRQYGVKGPEWD